MHKNNKELDQTELQTRANLEFAKDIYLSWDENGDGNIDENEIIKPLVSLGLAPDSAFARKICQSLDPRNAKQKEKGEMISLTLDDFVRIFKNDKISDALMQVIAKESEKRHLKFHKSIQVDDLLDHRQNHPDIEEQQQKLEKEMAAAGTKPKPNRNLSISMRSRAHKAIVEIPLDSQN